MAAEGNVMFDSECDEQMCESAYRMYFLTASSCVWLKLRQASEYLMHRGKQAKWRSR